MADVRFGRLQRAATLVPLALLSAAWSVSIATSDGGSAPASASADGTLPDGSTVPEEAIEAPASLSTRAQLAPGVLGDPDAAVGNAAVNGIPSAALAAYQRAETVINAADTACHLPWQLVAAIGRVESDHGRVHGSHLTSEGLARPAIYGLPLDGTQGTARIGDTDAGLLDHDTEFDRAVGPLQFIPSPWAIVGVDADGDSQRDPLDIDDAALATTVYLPTSAGSWRWSRRDWRATRSSIPTMPSAGPLRWRTCASPVARRAFWRLDRRPSIRCDARWSPSHRAMLSPARSSIQAACRSPMNTPLRRTCPKADGPCRTCRCVTTTERRPR